MVMAGLVKKRMVIKATGTFVAVSALVAGIVAGGALVGSDVDAGASRPNKGVKNVIVMISDGCGYNHIYATDYFTGKKQVYERFPVQLGMSTYEYEKTTEAGTQLLGYDPVLTWKNFNYSLAPLATDSASAATAMASGVKTVNGAIGVDVNGQPVQLVTQRAEAQGKATGVITTVEWSHATPAGFVAHNASRNNYAAIAQEMISSSGTDVIMGAGNPDFDDNALAAVPAKDAKYVGGASLWADLKAGIAGGDANGDGIADPWTLIQSKTDFEKLATARTTPKRVCGTFQAYTTTQQARSGDGTAAPYVVPLNATVPSLATMSKGALNVLDNDPDGFFLMIEGGAIDWASHANQTGRTIEEEIDFNDAVEAVVKWVERNSNWSETMLIVTGDHETGMLTGPGSKATGTFKPIVNNGRYVVPGVEWGSGDHTNQLIPLYAKGGIADFVDSYVRTKDPVRGAYIDNTDLAKLVFTALK
jgi:alkaline phosphatase